MDGFFENDDAPQAHGRDVRRNGSEHDDTGTHDNGGQHDNSDESHSSSERHNGGEHEEGGEHDNSASRPVPQAASGNIVLFFSLYQVFLIFLFFLSRLTLSEQHSSRCASSSPPRTRAFSFESTSTISTFMAANPSKCKRPCKRSWRCKRQQG